MEFSHHHKIICLYLVCLQSDWLSSYLISQFSQIRNISEYAYCRELPVGRERRREEVNQIGVDIKEREREDPWAV